jgi:hypothetical protein
MVFPIQTSKDSWLTMLYGSKDASELMVDREQIIFFHYSQSMDKHTK